MINDDEFKAAEMRVAAYTELTAEQGRALYAGYVKRSVEIDQLKADWKQRDSLKADNERLRAALTGWFVRHDECFASCKRSDEGDPLCIYCETQKLLAGGPQKVEG